MNYRLTDDDGQPPVIGATEPAAPESRTAARLSATAEPEPTPLQRLATYAQRVRRRWPLVALLTLIAGLVAFVHASNQPDEYRATSTLLFPQLQPASTAVGATAPQPADPERASNTNVKLVTLEPVAARVRAALGNRQSSAELLRRVTASVDNNSDLVSLSVREPTPRLAAAAANAFADQSMAFRRRLADADFSRVIRVTTRQLNALSPLERSAAQGRELRARLRQLQLANVTQSGAIHVVQRATVPSAPVSPHPTRSAILGLVLGLLFAVAVALIVDVRDPRLKSGEDIEGAFGLPVVEALPADGHASGKLLVPTAADRAAYQRIAARLRLSGMHGGLLLVSGTGRDSGQGPVSLGIAQALALDGQRVALIDLDVSNPTAGRLSQQLRARSLEGALANPTILDDEWIELDAADLTPARGASNGAGVFVVAGPVASLEAVLANPTSLEDEWTALDAADLTAARGESTGAGILVVAPAAQSPSLDEVPAGAMRALVSRATGLVDTAIVSLASLDDGLSIADTAGRALLVARRNETTKASAAMARRALMATGVRGLGVVVTAPSNRYRPRGLSTPASGRPAFLARRPESVA